MARTKGKYIGPTGNLTYTVGSETVVAMAPVQFYDDFLGFELNETESGSKGAWKTVEVSLNTAIAQLADGAGGQVALIMDVDNNDEDAVLYWGDQRAIDVSAQAVIEFRAKVSVLPTLTGQIVMGLCGDHNLDKDATLESCWFKLDGDGVVVCESDDTTNDNDDKASGVTVLATEWHVYRIDFTNLADVRFYIDGVRVATDTLFDMSNLAAAELVLQPYFSLDKTGDAGLGTLLLDYVRIWSNRS
jgi:hypothetical protein